MANPSVPGDQPTPPLTESIEFFDGTGAEEPAQPAVAPKPAVAHSQRSLRLAQEFGYTTEVVNSLSPAELDERVHVDNLAALRFARQLQHERATQQTFDQSRRQPVPEPQPVAAAKPTLDPELGYDPLLSSTIEDLRRENAALKAGQEQFLQATQRQQSMQIEEAVDSAFDAVAQTHGRIFGTGPLELLVVGSPEYQRRGKIFGTAGIKAGDSPRVAKQKVLQAIALMYPAQQAPAPQPETPAVGGYGAFAGNGPPVAPVKAVRPKGPNGQFLSDEEINVRRWMEGGLARPTQRSGAAEAEMNGVDKATRSVAAILGERGGSVGGESGEAGFDDFLGGLGN